MVKTDVTLATHILPYLIYNTLTLGSEEEKNDVLAEMLAVLRGGTSVSSPSKGLRAFSYVLFTHFHLGPETSSEQNQLSTQTAFNVLDIFLKVQRCDFRSFWHFIPI